MAEEPREKTLSHLSFYQIFRRISMSVREYKRPAILTPILVTGEVVIECAIPFITALLINALNEGKGMDAISHYSLILVALALVSLACGTVAGITCANASTGLAKNLRHDMFHNIQTFSFGNIDRFSTSSLVTRLTTDIANVQMAFMQIIRTAIRSPLLLTFATIMAFITGGRMAVVYVVVSILLGAFLFGIAMYVMPIFRRLFRKYDALNDTVEENIKGIRVVKAFVREKYEKQKFDTSSGNLYHDFVHVERLLAWNMPVMQLAINIVYVFVIYFGSHAIIESQGTNLALGQLSALITYGFSILMSLNMLSMIFVMLTMSEESARRIVEVLEEKSDLANPANPVYEVPDGSIDFDHVSFEYAGNTGDKALTDIDLHIKSG
ncbi:MAG: ABC transporter permease, partial [Coriobacteriaceae bacterium]|nr:ABC transporter permease [Coriobacteriaceae bacterium]